MVAAAEGAAAPLPEPPAQRPSNGHVHHVPQSSPRPAASPGGGPSARSTMAVVAPPLDGKPRLERVEFLITPTPVEGCELMPYVVIRTASGEAKSAEAIEAKTRGALSVQYRWNRCAATYVCARKSCLRPATMQFVPLLKIANERILASDEFDLVVKESFFCSQRCLQAAWPTLSALQTKMTESYPLREKITETADDAIARVRSEAVTGRTDGVFANPLPNPSVKTEVAWIRNYAPTAEDVGSVLELVCRYVYRSSKDSTVDIGPPTAIRSRYVKRLPDPPPERRMLSLMPGEESYYPSSRRASGSFRMLTYNVLAEIYTSAQTYPKCPNWALAWTYRKRNLIREIAKYEADILCLQEVQADHYEDHFQPYFSRMGYEGCYKVKTRESMGRKGKIDGCATLFRKDMYVMRAEHSTEYNTVAQQRTKSARALNRCLKGNVALILVLDATDGSGPIVVANTHLFWDPELTDVKLFQVDVFLSELELVLQKHRLGPDVPVIIGGDFNSEPMSSVYEYITTGSCTLSRADVPADSYGVLGTCNLRHNLHFRSAYGRLGQEPAFTNYTTNFVGVLDYLWYSPDALVPIAILEIPEEQVLLCDDCESASNGVTSETVGSRTGIPNTRWSSDHIALMTEFQILKPRHTMGRI